ncbi:lipopolysaccharide assembly protein LapB [Pseudorhodobacter sp.]|uniref:tetratricopeptide repeat protein n=1 Tax=Pseudorhodobacter sp. TaxID=1934400 RepID=UPI00264A24B0|nr:hypothetical protein [Pseudorhodobacter sp.]MDN5786676.1 hypothetical protein [Pseudorhodobacter sp.]
MKYLLVALLLLIAPLAKAQAVNVTSGEHGTFTRLVLSFPNQPDWRLFRTENGYGLSVKGKRQSFDLTDAYRRISSNRLSRIFKDPATGALLIEVNCACHALPFELRDRILVIDIKAGPAPDGSSFELSESGTEMTSLHGKKPTAKPKAVPGNEATAAPANLDEAINHAARTPRSADKLGFRLPPANLEGAEERLLWQLAKGAAQGTVEITKTLPAPQIPARPSLNESNITVGQVPGVAANTAGRDARHMTAEGTACLLDDDLNVAGWGAAGPVSETIGLLSSNLVGEFDRPDPLAIARAVKYHVYIGFGAEALGLIRTFKPTDPNVPIWEALAAIVDLKPDPGMVFSGMEVCNTNAALWAILADSEIPPPNRIAIPAVLRAFSALPLHLRRHLGPVLGNRFLSAGDTETARAIRDAILRAPGPIEPATHLLDAEIARANGHSDKAEATLAPLVGETGPVGLQSTISLIETQVQSGEEVGAPLTTVAEALLQEAKGGDEEAALRNALGLAYATQDRFDAAFAMVAGNPAAAVDVWTMLATGGSDDALLAAAVLDDTDMFPRLSDKTNQTFARRLLTLGFPQATLLWLRKPTGTSDPEAGNRQLLIGAAHLALRDAPAALRAIIGMTGRDADVLRANALAMLQDASASEVFERAGDMESAAQIARQHHEWPRVANLANDGTWRDAANLFAQPGAALSIDVDSTRNDASVVGPLATTRALLAESSAARELLGTLLSQQEIPDQVD